MGPCGNRGKWSDFDWSSQRWLAWQITCNANTWHQSISTKCEFTQPSAQVREQPCKWKLEGGRGWGMGPTKVVSAKAGPQEGTSITQPTRFLKCYSTIIVLSVILSMKHLEVNLKFSIGFHRALYQCISSSRLKAVGQSSNRWNIKAFNSETRYYAIMIMLTRKATKYALLISFKHY